MLLFFDIPFQLLSNIAKREVEINSLFRMTPRLATGWALPGMDTGDRLLSVFAGVGGFGGRFIVIYAEHHRKRCHPVFSLKLCIQLLILVWVSAG